MTDVLPPPELAWSGADACREAPPVLLLAGVRQFNARQFFECHETLEELWKTERRAVRQLYQGILQVGVGFYHLRRGNYRGAVLTLGWGLARLRPLRPECQGVLVERLVAEAEAAARTLAALGPQRMSEFDPRLIPTIQFSVASATSSSDAGTS